jgi:hypothetical protein
MPTLAAYAFSPSALAKLSLGALYDHATDRVPQWGSGVSGLEKRAEWRVAGLVGRSSVEYEASRRLGVIPGYSRCRCKGFIPRSRHAVVSEFIEYRLGGAPAIPVARLSGIATSIGITSLGAHDTAAGAAGRALLMVQTDLGFNVLQEFWPEIRRTLAFRRE